MSNRDRGHTTDVHADESPFVKLFSTKGRVKLIDILLQKNHSELTASQISDRANVSRSTFHRNIGNLVDIGLVSVSQGEGSPEKYQINKENVISQPLRDVQIELLKQSENVRKPSASPPPDIGVMIKKSKASTENGVDSTSSDVGQEIVNEQHLHGAN